MKFQLTLKFNHNGRPAKATFEAENRRDLEEKLKTQSPFWYKQVSNRRAKIKEEPTP